MPSKRPPRKEKRIFTDEELRSLVDNDDTFSECSEMDQMFHHDSDSTNIPVVIAYGSGFMFYFSAGLLYCSLGQLLENESEEVFRALCNLPWYRYSPAVRKDFIMMMRQARSPLIIDYHGRSKMNLDNFMQILRQSYSYFTLLQSVTGK